VGRKNARNRPTPRADEWARRTKSCATEQETTMKTENELDGTLNEAELDEVRGGVQLTEQILSEPLRDKINGVNRKVFERIAVTDFSLLKPFEPGGTLGLLRLDD
jgi:hypothetical protein